MLPHQKFSKLNTGLRGSKYARLAIETIGAASLKFSKLNAKHSIEDPNTQARLQSLAMYLLARHLAF